MRNQRQQQLAVIKSSTRSIYRLSHEHGRTSVAKAVRYATDGAISNTRQNSTLNFAAGYQQTISHGRRSSARQSRGSATKPAGILRDSLDNGEAFLCSYAVRQLLLDAAFLGSGTNAQSNPHDPNQQVKSSKMSDRSRSSPAF